MTPRGTHLLVECRGCTPAVLNDPAALEDVLRAAAAAIGARVISAAFHAFAPHGVTGVLLLAESHLSIHTWPEHGYAAIDLFTCGPTEPQLAEPILRASLGASELASMVVERGARLRVRA
ncbi:MAG TPA: adenosylmethionine decarboxylase [Polyangiales bacterium]